MAREDETESGTPYVVIEERSSDLRPFLLGALVGAAAALLLAPRSGAETRRVVGHRLRVARRKARDAADGVASTFAEARDQLEQRIESARAAVSKRSRQLNEAVAAGRVAAREAERELRSQLTQTASGRASPPSGGGPRRPPEPESPRPRPLSGRPTRGPR